MQPALLQTDPKNARTSWNFFSKFVSKLEPFVKQRKLTSDSGIDDEDSDDEGDVICENFKRKNSNSPFDNMVYVNDELKERKFDKHVHELMRSYEFVKICDEKMEEGYRNPLSSPEQRQRKMTPVPKSLNASNLSKEKKALASHQNFLSVDEEDEEDVEKFNYEDDYICPDITSCQRYVEKRNSWHGHTDEELMNVCKKRSSTLKKSKSLDRGKDVRRRRKYRNMSTSLPADRASYDTPFSYIVNKDQNYLEKAGSKKACCTHQKMDHEWEKENTICQVKVSIEHDSANPSLPVWMKEAEAGVNVDTNSSRDLESDDEQLVTEDQCDTLSTKLDIPTINWDKLNETKNKNNEILSLQRKMLAKQKSLEQRSEQRRRRKLTPSDTPSHSSLELLSSLKSSRNQSILEEEEEEEDC